MIRIILMLGLFVSLYSQEIKNIPNIVLKPECEKIMQTGDKELIAKSGCCSWHQGVCDCGSNGRVICCDGSYSPSCTCKGKSDLTSVVVH